MDSFTVLRTYIDVLQKWCLEHPYSDLTISTVEFSIAPLLSEVLKRVESQKYIFIANDGHCQAVDSQDSPVPESFKNKRYMKASTRSNIRDVIKVLFQLLNIHEKEHTITIPEFVTLCQFVVALQTENDDLSSVAQDFYKYIRKQFFQLPSFFQDKKLWQKKYRDQALSSFFSAGKNADQSVKSIAVCEQKIDDLSHHFDTQLTTLLSLKQTATVQQGAISNLHEVLASLNNDFHSMQQIANEHKEKFESLQVSIEAFNEKHVELKAELTKQFEHSINDLEARIMRLVDSSLNKPVISEIHSAVAEIKVAVAEIKVAEEEVKHAVEEVRAIEEDLKEMAEHQEHHEEKQDQAEKAEDSESEYETDSDIEDEPVQEVKVEEPVQETVKEEQKEEVKVEEPVQETVKEEQKEEVKVEEPVQETVKEEQKEEVKIEEPVREAVKDEQKEEVKTEEPVEEEIKEIQEEIKIEEPEVCEPEVKEPEVEPVPEICEPEICEPEVVAEEEKPVIMKQVSIAIKNDQNSDEEEDLEITRLGKYFVVKGTRVAVNLDDGNAIGHIDENGELHKEENDEVKQVCETYHIGFAQ